MDPFTPVNDLEILLRKLMRDDHTPVWSFFTPLAAARLYLVTKNYHEPDGSDLAAPPGQNPTVCIFKHATDPQLDCIGLYTAAERVEAAFEVLKLSRRDFTFVHAQGFELLRYVFPLVPHLWMNAGLVHCQHHLDPDLVEILLSRPQPPPASDQPQQLVDFNPGGNPARFLGPLRDFLRGQPTVHAAWIFGDDPGTARPAGEHAYNVGLVMQDPEDESLLKQVETMAKALTPVGM